MLNKILKYINSGKLLLDLFFIYIIGQSVLPENAFAKIHIALPFTNLPLFLGEMLMMAMFIYTVIYFLKRKIMLSKAPLIFFLLAALFIIIKSITGFRYFGTLAFRNAAMFYYSYIILIAFFNFKDEINMKQYLRYRLRTLVLLYALEALLLLRFNQSYRINMLIVIAVIVCFMIDSSKLFKLFYFFPLACSVYPLLMQNECRGSYVAFIGAAFFLFIILITSLKQGKIDRKIIAKIVSRVLIAALIIFSYTAIFKRSSVITLWTEFKSTVDFGNIKSEYQQSREMITEKLASNTPKELLDEHNKKYPIFRIYNDERDQGRIESTFHDLFSGVFKRYSQANKFLFSDKEATLLDNSGNTIGFRYFVNYSNIIWRLYIWKDMLQGGFKSPIWGVPFGKPYRSIQAILWLGNDNAEDVGWLEPHNSFIHMFYRGGVIGLTYFFIIYLYLFSSIFRLPRKKLFLLPIFFYLVYMFFLALTNVAFELPYHAIPFWFFAGIYLNLLRKKEVNESKS
ncbi:MAG: hypothetical protein ABIH18_09415 [Candidatus Omnitrophota bacterium]